MSVRQASRRIGVAALWLTLLLMLAGCSAAPLAEQLAAAQEAGTIPAAPAGNKLLVLGNNGNIYTLDPDGRNRVAVTRDAGVNVQYLQPTWAPNGERIAFTTLREEDDVTDTYISTARLDGSERLDLQVPFAPFYIYWNPSSASLAYLSTWNRGDELPGMALRLVELSQDERDVPVLKARTLAEGQPFYFSWSPAGDRIVTHIGNERLELQGLDGSQQPLYMSTGAFPAPVWSGDGSRLIFALSNVEEGKQRLVTTTIAGELLEVITDFTDRITFTLSPDGTQLAYAISENAGGGAFGPLYVVDMNTLATRQLSDAPVIAFFWSPDSTKLAYMEAEQGRRTVQLRWHVWDAQTRANSVYDAFLPTSHFYQNYLSFFDQYVQSMTIWSPDSRAFTYAGVNTRGVRGIWVQELDAAEAELVSSGIFSAWSPK